MRNHYYRLALVSCFAFSIFTESVSTLADTSQFNLSEVTEGNFVHLGLHVTIEDKQHSDIANIGFIVGASCVAVVDTGGAISIGKQLLASIKQKTQKPICYVINTHIHFDHILGNSAFKTGDTKFVGHHQLANAVAQNKTFFLENYKNDLDETPSEKSIVAPEILIDEKTELDLGGRKLTLIPYPLAHTHTDLIVIDNKTGTLWAGDLIFRERIPTLAGSLKGWLNVMDELSKLDVKHVIPGHGAIADSIEQAMEPQQKYFSHLLKSTRKAIIEGKFISDAMEEIDAENQFNWLLHEHQHPANVSKAFTELEWE